MGGRIDRCFARLRAEGRAGLIAYIAAGDPTLERTLEIACAMGRAGVDLLELGVPFSDPLADGVVNQLAAGRALAAGATLGGVLGMVREFRERSELPVVLFTYLNPLYRFGFAGFQRRAVEAGCDGALILDLPPEEEELDPDLGRVAGLDRIRLVAPTTPPERVRKIVAGGSGFVYYVSREGVTGERSALPESLGERVAMIRAQTDLPVAVGFGISTPAQAAQVARVADGVVVGSAIVRRVGEWGGEPDLAARIEGLVRPLAEAVRGARGG